MATYRETNITAALEALLVDQKKWEIDQAILQMKYAKSQSFPNTYQSNNPTEGDSMTELTNEQIRRRANPNLIQFNDLITGDVVTLGRKEGEFGLITLTAAGAMTVTWYSDDQCAGVGRDTEIWGRGDNALIQEGAAVYRLFGSAKAVKPKSGVSFDSVILPDGHKKQILDAISQVDNHKLIFEEWGFADIFEKGTAISLLFYGPPGTGKTLMGQAIADKFSYKLQVISTAETETPEPGGAERNVNKFFQEAMTTKTVLLFDECDSLITDRANVGMVMAAQINNLLSQLEKFTGIAIFTTNRLASLDPAFERRLSLKLEFELPGPADRLKIWRRMFPEKAPLADDIRWENLANVPIAGGHIKNVVLKAARTAAAADEKLITDDILWECLEKEVASAEAMQEAIKGNTQFYGTPIKGRTFTRDMVKTRKLIG